MKKFPSKAEILTWIQDNPTKTSKRDIGRAFGIKGAARIDLKRILKQLTAEGHLTKERRSYGGKGALPPVSVLRILAPDKDGDLWAAPMEWDSDDPLPKILFIEKKGDPALKESDRILCRLSSASDPDIAYEARLIRRIGTGQEKIIGLFRLGSEGGRIDRKSVV